MKLVYFYIFIIPVTFYLLKLFINFAQKNKIVAIGNNKNMHKGSIPRGAGIIFGIIY